MTSFPSVFHLQCNCIDILRVQDINWWQQGLYPGECGVSLLELGSSGVHAVSIAIKCEDNKIIYDISCILARQTLYQTRLSAVMTCSSIIELYSMDATRKVKLFSYTVKLSDLP